MDTQLKTCFKCGISKPRCDYYGHPRMGDGKLGKCKECTKADSKARYYAKHDEVLAYDRQRCMLPHRVAQRKQYIQSPRGKKVKAMCIKRYTQKFPEKAAAVQAVSSAIKRGDLVRQPCEKCGEAKSQAHHDDYSKPLSVRWLCVKHHREHHKNMKQQHKAAA